MKFYYAIIIKPLLSITIQCNYCKMKLCYLHLITFWQLL